MLVGYLEAISFRPPYGDTTLFATGIWPRAGLGQTALATALAGIGGAVRAQPFASRPEP